MVKVIWLVQGEEDFQVESEVEDASDFLCSLELVDWVTLDVQEYRVISKELVADKQPYIAVLLEA